MRRTSLLLLAAGTLLAAACTASTEPSGSASSTSSSGTAPSGVLPGYSTNVDQFAPLVITTIAPDPIPFTGTDGQVHVTYEIQVLNFSPRPATITQIETLRDGPDGDVLATMPQAQVVPRTLLVADYPATPAPVTEIPPGRVALLMLDDVYAKRADVPAAVTHRLSATFGPPGPDQNEFAARYPTASTQIGGTVTTSDQSPTIIGPPLAGDGWFVANGCCTPSAHRAGLLPVGGRINGVERYAIDWVQIDLTAPGLLDAATGYPATFHGDPASNKSYLAYRQPLLAVADATVVAVTDGTADVAPRTTVPGLRLDELGGNSVVLDIGGVYAFYGHLVPGSATVKVGDRVTRGKTIGLLGNSGNTSEAHLHFQLMRSISPLSGDNVPFEIDTLTFVGSAGTDGLVPGPDAGPRTNQLPLGDAITDFPPAP
jgi:Peptidase family M23